MERVLHCVGDNECWHSDGLPEGQGDGEIAAITDKANDDRGDGIFSSVKRREQELLPGDWKEGLQVYREEHRQASKHAVEEQARRLAREQARTEISTAIEMYKSMDMTFWLPQTEAVLAQVEGR